MYKKYLKRLLDFFISLFGIICLSPVFLIIALMIKVTSNGPILFKQERLGLKQKIFNIFKFRTMVVNAENIGDGLKIKSDDDPRVTKIGKLLRKTSLDELPQLFNVLIGNMSLVGPRPPVTYYPYKKGEYNEKRKHRFDVKPGITGYAQAKVRNSASWDDRIEYDLIYVDNISFLFDLKILWMTIKSVLKKDNIY